MKSVLIFFAVAVISLTGFCVERRFDVATLCCNCEDYHYCESHFDHLNQRTAGGHCLVMGTDAHRSKITANGNVLAAYYDTLTESWKKMSGAEKADVIHQTVLKNFTKTGPKPGWLILNEISAGTWPAEEEYRRWVVAVASTLRHKYKYSVVICAPFTHPGAHDADWQALAAQAYIGIECYLGGKTIQDHTNSLDWCEQEYRNAKEGFEKRGIPAASLFLVEHFAHTTPEKNWGRQGVSRTEWEKALTVRSQAAHRVAFAGFVSYAWGWNAMKVSDEEVMHFEDLYLRQKLP